MKKVLVISNYEAGRKKAVMRRKSVHKLLMKNCRNFKSISISELDNTDISEFDTILAIGGDGTVNKAASKIIECGLENIKLGIIPSGTANLLASKLRISRSVKNIFKLIENDYAEKIDVLQVNGKCCILRFGAGYDADIVCKTPQSLKNKAGYAAYLISGLIFAFRQKLKTYEIAIDGCNASIEASCIIAFNAANMFGNCVSAADNSCVNDGLMDIFILKTKNPAEIFYEMLRITAGIRKTSARASYLKARTLNIKTSSLLCHIDGEKTRLKEDVNISIINKKIYIYCSL